MNYQISSRKIANPLLVELLHKVSRCFAEIEQDFFGHINAPFKLINNKVIVPSNEEQERNSRSRSAKLRIAEKKSDE